MMQKVTVSFPYVKLKRTDEVIPDNNLNLPGITNSIKRQISTGSFSEKHKVKQFGPLKKKICED